MTVILADPRERNFATLLARDKLRLFDPATGHYLHMSGQGSTRTTDYAWLGFMHQAETLRHRATQWGRRSPRYETDTLGHSQYRLGLPYGIPARAGRGARSQSTIQRLASELGTALSAPSNARP